jgi:hypothetical protein
MAYDRSDMLYDDGSYYEWGAKADHDNPYYQTGTDHSLLNKTEGYEILYFINHLGKIFWQGGAVSKQSYQQIERMIRVSPGQQTHRQKQNWIHANWNLYQ